MIATGQFSVQAVWLAAEAIPVVLVVTALSATRPPPLPAATMKRVVCVFLVFAGAGMLVSSLYAMAG